MAAHRIHQPEDRGNLQILWVNLNGANMTIQEALRTVENISRRPTAPGRPALPGTKEKKGLPDKNGDPDKNPQADLPFVDPADDAEVHDVDAETQSPPPPARPARTTRLPKGIPDLDFNDGATTFRDYATEKKPKDQFEWYLLVASWMKKFKNVEEIRLAHIVSAKQYIGQDWATLPDDAGQPFRDGCRPKSGIFTRGARGLYRITPNGEDRVERMGKKE